MKSTITFQDTEQSLTIDDVRQFEIDTNIVLPENYKVLILKYNGGYTEDSDYIDVLMSIKYGKQTVTSVINIHQNIEKNIPDGYFPFATDWSDNPITICLKEGSDYGKIFKFYFDTDDEPKILANSLEDLLGVESIDDL